MIENLLATDRSFFLFLNSLHSTSLDSLMQFLSGSAIWFPLLIYLFWSAYQICGKKLTFTFVLFAVLAVVASDVTSSYVLKNLADRLRPCRELDLKPLIYSFGQKCGGKYGFVSSHAANSMVLIIFSIFSLSFSKTKSIALLIIPFAVGYSRIYLGVHYPGDILGGIVVGVIWGYLFFWMFKKI